MCNCTKPTCCSCCIPEVIQIAEPQNFEIQKLKLLIEIAKVEAKSHRRKHHKLSK